MNGVTDKQTFRRTARPLMETALCLILFCTGASRSRAEDQSGQVTVVTLDPYAGADWDATPRRKANLHSHSTRSDGQLHPHQVVDEYHRRGYAALALTDHNKVPHPWTDFSALNAAYEDRDPAALNMLAVKGNELSRHHHALSLFSDFDSTDTNMENVLTALGAHSPDARGVVCHPAMHWPRRFDAPAPEVRVALTPALRRLAQGDFTIEAWFRTTDAGRNILLGNFTGDDPGAVNLELHTENRVRLYIQPPKGRVTDLTLSAGAVNTRDGHWHHLAGVRRQGRAHLYLDGREIGCRADEAGAFGLTGASLFLGRDARTGATALNGDLGPVRLWTEGLADQEIAALADTSAATRLPQDFGKSRLLAEYLFEQGAGAPLGEGPRAGVLDDTAGHAAGPFHASASYVTLAADANGPVRRVARFSPAQVRALPESVPDGVVDEYAGVFRRHGHLRAIEVCNGTRPLTEYPLDRALWDGLLGRLMPQRPVWGLAVDDMHSLTHLGRDWATFLAPSRNVEAIRQALDNGAYTFSSRRVAPQGGSGDPPRVERITHDAAAGRITLAATADGKPLPAAACVWISMGRQVHAGPSLDYRALPGIGCYARAEITAPGGTTFINPYGFALTPRL